MSTQMKVILTVMVLIIDFLIIVLPEMPWISKMASTISAIFLVPWLINTIMGS